MSWVAIIVDSNDNKVKIDWFSLKKIILGTVRGDQFLYIYIYFLKKITSTILIAIVFLSLFFDHLFLGPLFYFILSFLFHFYLPRVN